MLVELAVTDLGVIDELSLVLGPGLTAVTGETGAGKTMVVEAIELLVGGRAEPALVRPGRDEARVEGRFVAADDREVVVARVVPRTGRSRAYVDGRFAPAGALAELGADLVDLHGQHSHQSLLTVGAQRASLDAFGGIDLEPLRAARREASRLDAELAALGGDARARARQLDLVRFEVGELADADLADPAEDERLAADEDMLADALAHRAAAATAHEAVAGDGAARDAVATALAALTGRPPFGALTARLGSLAVELDDIATEVRAAGEAIEEDPERLEAVRVRRRLLHDLRRKYGDTLADVIAYRDEAVATLRALESHDERAAALEAERQEALSRLAAAAAVVAARRASAAPELAAAVEAHLWELAMPSARVSIDVTGTAGEDVAFLLAANAGAPLLPLARVASGGELARAMLALRLVASGAGGPSTLVFDEVDAGIGGAAAIAVGRALATLAARRQVLVVTHLPQVAAHADHHVHVAKRDDGVETVAHARLLAGEDRVTELSRMLSGLPESESGRVHAADLLLAAGREVPR